MCKVRLWSFVWHIEMNLNVFMDRVIIAFSLHFEPPSTRGRGKNDCDKNPNVIRY